MKRLALITARGGSKRIPKKNIRSFLGRPIIAYSIEAALQSEVFDEVMVSTDSEEIAEVARSFGAAIPFLRSAANSNDFAITADVISEVISSYEKLGKVFDVFTCVYPTAPFVTGARLKEAVQLLENSKDTDLVFPVTKFSFPVQRAVQIKDGYCSMVDPKHIKTRSQDLEPRYHDCGQFYCGWVKPFKMNHSILPEKTKAIVVSELEVQDIDSEEDWKIAEIKFEMMLRRQGQNAKA